MGDKKVTLYIDEVLFADVKKRALLEGLTLKGIISHALYNHLDLLEAREDEQRKAGTGRFRIQKALKNLKG